ncbi:glucose 1-dehydrogenase [Alkalihalobacillus oceani]|uniref:Glucose 1-dehydrogenase n=1 Tax=Halalkalibacter oceani TaxID=1653776 RepID=A0A9X2DP31_9BACI|nr:glucose 1-dehydrogenase [Halalkalibacter oceani]MCM3713490.1 glucose 1-dehydrogenase [Halalkalibacter oceani]
MNRLAKQVVAITGAGKGIGRAAALKFASEGAAVLVTDQYAADAEKTVRLIEEQQGKAFPLAVDVRDKEAVSEIPAIAQEQFAAPLTVMVNNAGIQQVKDILTITADDWDRMLDINARGSFFGMQVAAAAMKQNRTGGVIINVASVMGRNGHPLYAHYAASKAAIISLTKSFALALADTGIRVNAVAPGIVDTALWERCDREWAELKGMKVGEPKRQRIGEVPLARAGTPDDVAGAIAFLASREADYVTGECLHISGGAFML